MILIINNSNYDINQTPTNKMLYKIISDLVGKDKVIINNTDELNTIFLNKTLKNSIKGVILSGSELRIGDKNLLNKIFNNILPIIELNVPILGVCFGLQVLGILYKSKFGSYTKRSEGYKRVILNNRCKIFKGFPVESVFHFTHFDYLKGGPLLKDKFNIISTNEEGNIIYGIKHKKKHIYGIQFHPECDITNVKLYKNFLEICKF
tara:strand:- start:966 stop:1583 length:618 start_codon:yes stop_codon:yes gene_type:complete